MEAKTVSLKTFTAALLTILVIESGFRLTISETSASSLLALGTIRCLESISLIFIALSLEKRSDAIGLSRSKILAGFTRGLIWSAFFGIVAGVSYLVLIAAGINALGILHSPRPSSGLHIFFLLTVGGVIAPITEEIFFRGIIYGFIRQWGAIFAIILSTLIFVFTHPLGNNLPVTQFIGGIVFAIAYEKEQNLIVPITIHCLGNLTIFSLSIFM